MTISAAVYVWFLAGFWSIATDPAFDPGPATVAASGVVTALGLRDLVALESRRPGRGLLARVGRGPGGPGADRRSAGDGTDGTQGGVQP